jgi:aldose 1-epimerase
LSHAQPFDLASNLLVPWSNRISGDGFHFAGRFHRLDPNLPGEPYPIHGNGLLSTWSVEKVATPSAELSLTSNGPGPFRYKARASYALTGGTLTMRLHVRNIGLIPLPFGLGFHPWIVRSPQTQLKAKAARIVFEGSDHLPAGDSPLGARPEWDFTTPRALPRSWINNAFLGWNGRADILWPDRKLALEIAADPRLSVYIVYSPSADADFFCFEPVMHAVDAHNQDGDPEANGLKILAPGEVVAVSCSFRPRHLA